MSECKHCEQYLKTCEDLTLENIRYRQRAKVAEADLNRRSPSESKLRIALSDTIRICELTFGKDFRNAAADIPERLFNAKQVLAGLEVPHLPLATNKDGWLCPNCLKQNVSEPPKKDDVLVCEHCRHTTLIE